MGTDIHPYAEVRVNGKWVKAEVNIPNERNYWAFAVLAGVRNGVGFAGCDTGNEVLPISEPRGLPNDTAIKSNEVDYDDPGAVWLGDHSFSHVLLSELLAIDFEKKITERGFVSKEQAARVAEGQTPTEWCGGTTNPEYVRAQWERPLRDAAWLIPKMIDVLAPLGEPENVRLVFGFDS